MKKTILAIVLSLVFFSMNQHTQAQMSNLVFFSQHGEHFVVELNSVQQNPGYESNLKITGLPATSYKVTIRFEDHTIPDLNKTITFQSGMETSYNIRKNKSGVYTVRFMNQVAIDVLATQPQDQVVITFIPQMREINRLNTFDPHKNPYKMPGYHGAIGCPYPMTEQDFKDFKETITSKNFEDSKLQIAKEGINTNCLSVAEIVELMGLFNFEASRLDFAKFAYLHTYDIDNYFKVNKAFQFDSSISDLKDYIEKNKQH